MEVYDLKDKKEYIEEVMTLEYNEWAENIEIETEYRIKRKIKKYEDNINNKYFCKMILLDNDKLIGFISIFPQDGLENLNLTPWYATMYVKKEYRGLGYSKILNDAILKEAKKRKIKTIYLKTDLNNYYEKFGAIFIQKINDEEKLYKFEID